MRKAFLALVPWIIASVAVGAGLWLRMQSGASIQGGGSNRESFVQAKCPFEVAPELADLIRIDQYRGDERLWRIYKFQTSSPAPTVEVGLNRSVAEEIGRTAVCQLRFSGGRQDSGESVDWRIGHVLAVSPGLARKRVRVTYQVKADRPITLNTGEAYLYDGAKVASMALGSIGETWKTFVVEEELDPRATQLEVWFRLILGKGTIVPGEGVIFFSAVLSGLGK